jgi:hypothetical protein
MGLGGLAFASELVLPEWYTLLWFAFGTFVALNAGKDADPAVEPAEMPAL